MAYVMVLLLLALVVPAASAWGVVCAVGVCAVLYLRRRNAVAVIRRRALGAPVKVVFVHPDLGLGGAERLVVDAAVGLMRNQTQVACQTLIATAHHDPTRAFRETTDGSVEVRVYARAIPQSIASRGKVLLATLRMVWTCLYVACSDPDTDVYFVDQVAAAMPVLAVVAPRSVGFFYCHFPDQRCDPNRPDGVTRGSLPYRVYRSVFDAVEGWAMGFAGAMAVNSQFTRQVTVETFPPLERVIDRERDVLYPPVSVQAPGDGVWEARGESDADREATHHAHRLLASHTAIVSINRFERKKNVELAVRAFAALRRRLGCGESADAHRRAACEHHVDEKPLLLVLAGGYDPRLAENVAYFEELRGLAAALEIPDGSLVMLRNISEGTKRVLLSESRCLLYTPTLEHFGIVPVEAMLLGTPVVAVNAGGPTESVTPGDRYGFLREPTPEAFAEAMAVVVQNPSTAREIGAAAKARAQQLFHLDTFSANLARRLRDLCQAKQLAARPPVIATADKKC